MTTARDVIEYQWLLDKAKLAGFRVRVESYNGLELWPDRTKYPMFSKDVKFGFQTVQEATTFLYGFAVAREQANGC